jgi:hypothetical protein
MGCVSVEVVYLFLLEVLPLLLIFDHKASRFLWVRHICGDERVPMADVARVKVSSQWASKSD